MGIEHAFGVLKGRWGTLRQLPIRIGDDVRRDSQRAVDWILACVTLHNMLHEYLDNSEWLADTIEVIQHHERAAGGARNAVVREESDNQLKVAGEVLRASLLARCERDRVRGRA